MAIFLALGAAILAVLVWAGRQPRRAAAPLRIACALAAALAAAVAVVAGLRGAWIASLALVALSVYLGQRARPPTMKAPPNPPGSMSLREAQTLLAVGPGASRVEIDAAYRRLMQRAHPDHGGSAGLAAQLNAARDRLLG